MLNKKVLVTGSNGRLGRLLRGLWSQNPPVGWHPIWLGREPACDIDHIWEPGVSTHALPHTHAILALWGVVPGLGNLDDNSRLAEAAMELGKSVGAQHVLHCSSAAVYGAGHSLKETCFTAPETHYGQSKKAMEDTVESWVKAYPDGPTACLMRLANVVGADSLFSAMNEPKPMVLDQFSDGSFPCRSYVSVSCFSKAIQGILNCIPSNFPPVVNIAEPDMYSMWDLVRSSGRAVRFQKANRAALTQVGMDVDLLQGMTGALTRKTATNLINEWRKLNEVLA